MSMSGNKIKYEVDIVKKLGDEIGYGHLMELASALWRKTLEEEGYPTSGAFVTTLECFLSKEIMASSKAERKLYDNLIRL